MNIAFNHKEFCSVGITRFFLTVKVPFSVIATLAGIVLIHWNYYKSWFRGRQQIREPGCSGGRLMLLVCLFV